MFRYTFLKNSVVQFYQEGSVYVFVAFIYQRKSVFVCVDFYVWGEQCVSKQVCVTEEVTVCIHVKLFLRRWQLTSILEEVSICSGIYFMGDVNVLDLWR